MTQQAKKLDCQPKPAGSKLKQYAHRAKEFLMKQFKPKMTDGAGNSKKMSPEAHNEWVDKGGKHEVDTDLKQAASGTTPSSKVGPDGFEPQGASKQGSTHGHEKKQIAKGYDSPSSQGLFKQAGGAGKSGFGQGPKKGAGKGSSGSIKEFAGSGKLNKGNGLKQGAGN